MILQSLHNYYDRLAEQNQICEFGFSIENIGFVLEINPQGNLIQDNDIRINEGNKLRPILMEIPFSNEVNVRSSNVQPNFLVDKACYILGMDKKTKPDRLIKCYADYIALINRVKAYIADDSLDPVIEFYKKWNPAESSKLKYWEDISSDTSGLITFRLSGTRKYLHDCPNIRKAWKAFLHDRKPDHFGLCLITGHPNVPLQGLCAQFKGIAGGQSSGMSLVSVNMDSAESYNKKDTYNSPVSVTPEFKSSTALKYLIRSGKQHIYIGEAFTVFWTQRDSPIEGMFGVILDPKDVEAEDQVGIKHFLEAARDGKEIPDIDPEVRFYILGLSPNAARLSVRFWHVCTVGELKNHLGEHFSDLQIEKSFDNEPEFPGIWRLLRETVNQKSQDKKPSPLLAGAMMQAILEGTTYPQGLQNAVMNRIRADQQINYLRAAILKAILVRKHRIYKSGMEVSMALDIENKNPAYLLGRLFAALERVQEDAHRDESGKVRINSTIKDRFWGAASATPKVVFPQLLGLKNHHVAKIDNPGIVVNHEKLIGGIINDIESTGFKAHLTLDEQGVFTIGYYHQRQTFYQKKSEKE